MFVRVLFLLLVALNLGAGAWLLFGREPHRALPPASDPGVTELRLVSEVGSTAPVATPVPTPAPRAAASTLAPARPVAAACASVGSFAPRAVPVAMGALSPRVGGIHERAEPIGGARGYWVYLPVAANRDMAVDEARALAAKGVHDHYVVNSGDLQNAVSLGLYNAAANAWNRVAELQNLGFAPSVKPRGTDAPAYWLDYSMSVDAPIDWPALLQGRDDSQSQPSNCF